MPRADGGGGAPPELTGADALRVMTDAADEIDAANAHDDASGRSNSHGFGRINIGRALGGL